MSYTAFDNTGAIYNASAIVGPGGLFDEQAYANYSPVFMPISIIFAYGLAFGTFTAVLVHTFCMTICDSCVYKVDTDICSVVQTRHRTSLQNDSQGRT